MDLPNTAEEEDFLNHLRQRALATLSTQEIGEEVREFRQKQRKKRKNESERMRLREKRRREREEKVKNQEENKRHSKEAWEEAGRQMKRLKESRLSYRNQNQNQNPPEQMHLVYQKRAQNGHLARKEEERKDEWDTREDEEKRQSEQKKPTVPSENVLNLNEMYRILEVDRKRRKETLDDTPKPQRIS